MVSTNRRGNERRPRIEVHASTVEEAGFLQCGGATGVRQIVNRDRYSTALGKRTRRREYSKRDRCAKQLQATHVQNLMDRRGQVNWKAPLPMTRQGRAPRQEPVPAI